MKWNRRMEQKAENLTKMVGGAHSRPHFSEDERVFMVLKYTETGNVLAEGFKGSSRIRRHCADKQLWTITISMSSMAKVWTGTSAKVDFPVQKLPLQPSDCFQNITGFCIIFETIPSGHSHPFIYWKLWSGMCVSDLRTVLLLSVPFVSSSSWFHLSLNTRAVSE